jgi:hypothetical protein
MVGTVLSAGDLRQALRRPVPGCVLFEVVIEPGGSLPRCVDTVTDDGSVRVNEVCCGQARLLWGSR